jgi:hypothetical protein
LTQNGKDGWGFSKSIKILAIWRTYTGGADIDSSQLQGHISTVAEERSGTPGNRVFARKRNRVAREEKPTQSAWPKWPRCNCASSMATKFVGLSLRLPVKSFASGIDLSSEEGQCHTFFFGKNVHLMHTTAQNNL